VNFVAAEDDGTVLLREHNSVGRFGIRWTHLVKGNRVIMNRYMEAFIVTFESNIGDMRDGFIKRAKGNTNFVC